MLEAAGEQCSPLQNRHSRNDDTNPNTHAGKSIARPDNEHKNDRNFFRHSLFSNKSSYQSKNMI